jgi:hypothetical protein
MRKLFTLLLLALTISAFSTSITFEVSMKGSGVEYNPDSVFVVGNMSDWGFVRLTDQGDSLFSTTMNIPAGDSAVYYFITVGYWASDYLDYRETVPLDCDDSFELFAWEGDRAFIAPAEATKVSWIWGTCDPVSPVVNAIGDVHISSTSLTIYPNPGEKNVTVEIPEFSGFASVELIDLSGKNVLTLDALSNEQLINVSELAKGVYMVKVNNGNSLSFGKLVVR